MVRFLKFLAKSALQRAGYDIQIRYRPVVSGYRNFEWLLHQSRYEPLTIELFQRKFRIADSLSFYYSYQEIFGRDIYLFHSDKKDPLIIDCGSNYGTSILYFKRIFPEARIIAFEPDPAIFDLLRWNMHSFGFEDVEIHNLAIWQDQTSMPFSSDGADGGRIVSDVSQNMLLVPTVRLDDYLVSHVDMLKIDIEGAEVDVLATVSRLQSVTNVFIEYHSFMDQQQRLPELLSLLRDAGFRYQVHTQFSPQRPFVDKVVQNSMDLQLNVFAYRGPK